MTPGRPTVSGRQIVKALEGRGFRQYSQKGSHVKLRNDEGRTVIVPLHKELARGTVTSNSRQAGMALAELHSLI